MTNNIRVKKFFPKTLCSGNKNLNLAKFQVSKMFSFKIKNTIITYPFHARAQWASAKRYQIAESKIKFSFFTKKIKLTFSGNKKRCKMIPIKYPSQSEPFIVREKKNKQKI